MHVGGCSRSPALSLSALQWRLQRLQTPHSGHAALSPVQKRDDRSDRVLMRLTRATAVQWLELESLDSGLASLSSRAWEKSTWVRGASGRTLDWPAGHWDCSGGRT